MFGYCTALATEENVVLALEPTKRIVPTTITRITANITVKHSGVRHFKVELCGTEGEIQLTVSDLGVGFDPQDAISRRGLGLISMRERMQLVGGEISIKSQPGSGTTILARVPFSGTDSLLAVG